MEKKETYIQVRISQREKNRLLKVVKDSKIFETVSSYILYLIRTANPTK